MSEDRDPRCVHVAPDLRVANIYAAWLGEKGFLCEAVAPDIPDSSPDGLAPTEATPPGVEVRVIDVDQAQKARDAIEESQAVRAVRERRAARTGTVTAACEECGASSEWPAVDMGSTQECPTCGRYMDVPDPDEDWGDVDFGTEDDGPPPAAPKPAD
jgi:hypothetical protein